MIIHLKEKDYLITSNDDYYKQDLPDKFIRIDKIENIEELLSYLNLIDNTDNGDPEDNHIISDNLLLLYINNVKITEKFKSIKKWYA